jgi:hypothetical protein
MTRTIHACSSARQKRSSTHLDLVPPLPIDLLLRLFPLFASFHLARNLHDLDPSQWRGETIVESEFIR